MEIACDESGYEGEKLIGTTTDAFAHASVSLDADAAVECVRELRERIRSPATEYKANHILRDKHWRVLEWLLGPDSPLRGQASVFLIDKELLVLRRLVDALAPDQLTAATLRREGRRTFGQADWEDFLAAANDLLRTRAPAPVDGFYRRVEAMGSILTPLRATRDRAVALRARLLDVADPVPLMDPLFPAILRAVAHWGVGGRGVAIAHDQQNTLTAVRIAQLKSIATDPPLVDLVLVDSFVDMRVQVADVLGGAVRKVASDDLLGRGDPALTVHLESFVDPYSIWDRR